MDADSKHLYDFIVRAREVSETQLRGAFGHWGEARLRATLDRLVAGAHVLAYRDKAPTMYVVNPAVPDPE